MVTYVIASKATQPFLPEVSQFNLEQEEASSLKSLNKSLHIELIDLIGIVLISL